MLTTVEFAQAVLLPAIVAMALAWLARWRRWDWALPLAIAGGFAAGWIASRGVPALHPFDGTDWLFWIAIGAAFVASIVIQDVNRRPPWTAALAIGWLAVIAGLSLGAIAWPLVASGSVRAWPLVAASGAVTAWALVLAYAARVTVTRIGPVTPLVVVTMSTGAIGVVVFSSNLRVVGVYGLSAAAALAGTAASLLAVRRPVPVFASTAVTLYAATLMAGLLSGGHYYPDPGVSWGTVVALFASPLLVLVGALLPTKRKWLRSAVALLAVGIAAAAIAVPAAVKAKKAAEEDPYAGY